MFAVLGAGPTGLAVAWQLHRAGHDVTVVEATARVGGHSGSRTVSGTRVDLGARWIPPRAEAVSDHERRAWDVLDEVADIEERRRIGRVRVGDGWVREPVSPLRLTGRLGVDRWAALRDVATRSFPATRPDDASPTLEAFVRAEVGPTAWQRVFEPLAMKRWATAPSTLGPEVGAQLLASVGWDRGAVPLRRPGAVGAVAGGIGSIAEGMAARLPSVRLDSTVTGLIEQDERVVVGLRLGRIVNARHVFSTLPAWRTAAWLGLVEERQVRVPSRSLVLVYLTIAGGSGVDAWAHHLPARNVLPLRITEPRITGPAQGTGAADRSPDRTVLCAEVPCWRDDEIWRARPVSWGDGSPTTWCGPTSRPSTSATCTSSGSRTSIRSCSPTRSNNTGAPPTPWPGPGASRH